MANYSPVFVESREASVHATAETVVSNANRPFIHFERTDEWGKKNYYGYRGGLACGAIAGFVGDSRGLSNGGRIGPGYQASRWIFFCFFPRR